MQNNRCAYRVPDIPYPTKFPQQQERHVQVIHTRGNAPNAIQHDIHASVAMLCVTRYVQLRCENGAVYAVVAPISLMSCCPMHDKSPRFGLCLERTIRTDGSAISCNVEPPPHVVVSIHYRTGTCCCLGKLWSCSCVTCSELRLELLEQIKRVKILTVLIHV